jgi:thiamine biosynthesis protein ThiS
MITLQVNGKNVELERPTPLLAYIEKLGVDPRAVAVEHNGTILERAAYEGITLNGGDVVEIVRMVGGGKENDIYTASLRASRQPFFDRRFCLGPFVPWL